MGCLKLKYQQNTNHLKVVYSNVFATENTVQWFLSVDPLADQFAGWSPYNAFACNPIRFVDPDGRAPVDVVPGTADNSGTKPMRAINFGLFTLTFRKGERSDATGNPKRSIRFDWNYTFSKEKKTITKWDTEKFEISNITHAGYQSSPHTVNYPPVSIGTATNGDGQTLNSKTAGLSNLDYGFESIKLEVKANDNGGNSFYRFNLGGQVVDNQIWNRVSFFNVSNITPATNLTGGLIRQTAGLGAYDSCDGYKLVMKVQFKTEIIRQRLKIVKKAPG